jgi:hypothetical protein
VNTPEIHAELAKITNPQPGTQAGLRHLLLIRGLELAQKQPPKLPTWAHPPAGKPA